MKLVSHCCARTDCGFTIIVDSGADVAEHGGESNNTIEGFCLN